MQFDHSTIVDPSTFDTQGLCPGLELRNNRDLRGEKTGVVRAQRDWESHIGPIPPTFAGCLGDKFNFVALTLPEVLPERLEIVAYATEFAYAYDDLFMEHLDQDLGLGERSQILNEFNRGLSVQAGLNNESTHGSYKLKGVKLIQSQILAEMMAIDPARTITAMKYWQKYHAAQASRKRSEPFTNLDEFLPFRVRDSGELYWFAFVTFGMGLTIPDHEMDRCMETGRPSWTAIALINDLFSWAKERQEADQLGHSHVNNAIWVLMSEHSIDEAKAKEMCRRMINEHVAQAVGIADAAKKDTSLSPDLRRYTQAIIYTIKGLLV